MISDKQRRNQLIQKIQKMPADKLKELHDFANKLDLDSPQKKKILSYAGCWSNLEEAIFEDLTDNLADRRQRNQRRFEK